MILTMSKYVLQLLAKTNTEPLCRRVSLTSGSLVLLQMNSIKYEMKKNHKIEELTSNCKSISYIITFIYKGEKLPLVSLKK